MKHMKEKKKYIFLIGLAVVGILFGILFAYLLSKEDKLLTQGYINNFFEAIHNGKIHYKAGIVNGISISLLYTTLIFILGISIVGIPIILFMLFFKGFIVGFSIGTILNTYKVKGIIGAFFYVFPHHIISLVLLILLSYFAILFSKRMVEYLFLKKEVGLKKLMQKYSRVFAVVLIGMVLCSVFEIFLSPFLLKVFTNMLF